MLFFKQRIQLSIIYDNILLKSNNLLLEKAPLV